MRRTVLVVTGVVVLVVVLAGATLALSRRGAGGSAGGTPSTAASVPLPATRPGAVVEAFLRAVKAGDCRRQEALVTPRLIASSGGCTTGTPSAVMRWANLHTTLDPATRTAQVSFEVSDTGSQEGRVLGLVVAGGAWRIDDFHAEATPIAPATVQ